jgi:SpoVK/Ycf46/Vps4 family AAA+-type ATPase
MKAADVVDGFRCFLNGDFDGGLAIVKRIEAGERKVGTKPAEMVANQLRNAIGSANSSGALVPLPNAPSEIRLIRADKQLGALTLPAKVREDVERMVAEYRSADTLRKHGLKPRTTILLYGPSGNGKTALVNAIANALSLPLCAMNYGETIASRLGETTRNISEVMGFARSQPMLMFFDEADSIVSARSGRGDSCDKERNNAVNQILTELDARTSKTLFAFATNFDDQLDPAFRRRVEIDLELPAPTEEARRLFILKAARRFPFLGDEAANIEIRPSYAECEQAVEDAARAKLLAGVRKAEATR